MDYLKPLYAQDLRALGIPAPWGFGRADMVRFSEIDALKHVNHTASLRWFESFRIGYFAAYGITEYRPNDMQVVLRDISISYRAPLFLGEDYVVTGRTSAFRTSSFTMDYAVWVGGEARITSSSVIVCLEEDQRTKRPLTDAMRATMTERDGAEDAR